MINLEVKVMGPSHDVLDWIEGKLGNSKFAEPYRCVRDLKTEVPFDFIDSFPAFAVPIRGIANIEIINGDITLVLDCKIVNLLPIPDFIVRHKIKDVISKLGLEKCKTEIKDFKYGSVKMNNELIFEF